MSISPWSTAPGSTTPISCRLGGTTRWLFSNGEDAFVHADHVLDVWETPVARPAAA
jgi:hypothetical protein